MGEINKLKSFDNTRKNYQERKEHVNNVLSSVDIDYLFRSSLPYDHKVSQIENRLDKLGTYLLKSHDIISERNLKYSFYRDEQRYREYTVGRQTDIIDFGAREDIHPPILKEEEDLTEEYIFRLFDPENLTIKEKRNILKIGISNISNVKNKYIIEEIDNFLSYYIEKAKNGKELLIFNYAIKGLTDDEISRKIKVPRQTVSKIINKVIG